MVLFWLMSIFFPLVLTQRKGHLARGSCAGKGRHRDCILRRWMPMCLRGSTVVGPQGRDPRVGSAPGCFTLAAASFVNLCGSSPLQCPQPSALGVQLGTGRHPQLLRVTLPLGPAAGPLCGSITLSHCFSFLTVSVEQSFTGPQAQSLLLIPRELDCFFPFLFSKS